MKTSGYYLCTFLAAVALAGGLLWYEPRFYQAFVSKAEPSAFARMLQIIRNERKVGIVICIPEEERDRLRLGQSLVDAYDADCPGEFALLSFCRLHPLLAETVILCLDRGQALRRIRESRPGENIILIDEYGARIDGREASIDSLCDVQKFEDVMEELVYGKGDSRLAARWADCQRLLPAEIIKLSKNVAEDLTRDKLNSMDDIRVLRAARGVSEGLFRRSAAVDGDVGVEYISIFLKDYGLGLEMDDARRVASFYSLLMPYFSILRRGVKPAGWKRLFWLQELYFHSQAGDPELRPRPPFGMKVEMNTEGDMTKEPKVRVPLRVFIKFTTNE